MEKHCKLSSNKYGQQSYVSSQSFNKGRLALFMVCVMFVQILSDIWLEIYDRGYLVNAFVTGICTLSTLYFFIRLEKQINIFTEKTVFINIILVFCVIFLILQRIVLLGLFDVNDSILMATIIINWFIRLRFWTYLSTNGNVKYRKSVILGLLNIAITFLCFLPFYSGIDIHIFQYHIEYFYLIVDSILWNLSFVSFIFYHQTNITEYANN